MAATPEEAVTPGAVFGTAAIARGSEADEALVLSTGRWVAEALAVLRVAYLEFWDSSAIGGLEFTTD